MWHIPTTWVSKSVSQQSCYSPKPVWLSGVLRARPLHHKGMTEQDSAVLGERREYIPPYIALCTCHLSTPSSTATHRPPFFTLTSLRLVSANPPQSAPLTTADFREPAFHPPLTSLSIMYLWISFSPVDLKLSEELT